MCILSCPTISIANCNTYTYSADNFWLTYVTAEELEFTLYVPYLRINSYPANMENMVSF
jgi:hypothetical protein